MDGKDGSNLMGCVVWFTGLPASGKTTLAKCLEARLKKQGKFTYVLDGDMLRQGLNSDLGFSLEDRKESVRRVGEVASLFADSGCIVIVALISPFRADRENVRSKVRRGSFFEIYLSTPLICCEKHDPKGHYTQARQGLIPNFTGISSPYEPPQNAEAILDTSLLTVENCVDLIMGHKSFISNFL